MAVEVQNDGLAAGAAKIKAAERPAHTVPMKSIILVLRSIGYFLPTNGTQFLYPPSTFILND
jgi:hypothetical protein